MSALFSFINSFKVKSHLTLSRCKLLLIPCLTIISLTFTGSVYANGSSNVTSVVCTGKSGSADRLAIQAAINSARPGAVIKLMGTCQLDGQEIFINTSNITLQGVGAQGNWTTVLSGLTGTNGLPLTDFGAPTYQFFNRGISIGPSNNTISNVTIQGIKFINLHRGVVISPSIAGNSSLCSGYPGGVTITTGNASNIVVGNNWFDNNTRALSNFGTSDHINLVNNLITNTGNGSGFTDITIEGQQQSCSNPNGSQSSIEIGTPASINVSNNTIKNDLSEVPILAIATNQVIANNNITSGSNIYVAIDSAALNSLIIGNVIDGSSLMSAGIEVDFPFEAWPNNAQTSSLVTLNTIKNSAPSIGTGAVVDSSVSGAIMIGNFFNNISSADYLLCDADANTNDTAAANCAQNPNNPVASFNNTIVSVIPSTTIMNLGNNNQIIGKYMP